MNMESYFELTSPFVQLVRSINKYNPAMAIRVLLVCEQIVQVIGDQITDIELINSPDIVITCGLEVLNIRFEPNTIDFTGIGKCSYENFSMLILKIKTE